MAWGNNASTYGNNMNMMNAMPMNAYAPAYNAPMGYVNNIPNLPATQIAQPVQPQQMAQNVAIQGRMVTSKEEALGIPVDFSGQPMYFPDISKGVIYSKVLDMNTGAAKFSEYRLYIPPQEQPQENKGVSFVPLEDFQNLNEMVSSMQDTIDSLQKEIDRLKKPANSAAGKAVKKDEQ